MPCLIYNVVELNTVESLEVVFIVIIDASSDCFIRYDAADGWRRAAAPPQPSGGSVQDVEVRAALAATVAALQHLGILAE